MRISIKLCVSNLRLVINQIKIVRKNFSNLFKKPIQQPYSTNNLTKSGDQMTKKKLKCFQARKKGRDKRGSRSTAQQYEGGRTFL